jgi:hypothetical protein
MTGEERKALIAQYDRGPRRLREALAKVPAGALTWRPRAGEWSAHEIVLHCADSETNAVARIRYLLAEDRPTIVGYDQDRWAQVLEYHALPLEPALLTVEAVRANAVPLLQRLPDAAWTSEGTHTESGRYSAEDWLRTYAEHLHLHARQIEDNVAAWKSTRGR